MCCKAYNILRKHGALFLNLFVQMIPAGMPELLDETDVQYLQVRLLVAVAAYSYSTCLLLRTQRQLALQDTNAQAEKKFKQEIQNALKTVSRQFDNMVHNIVHS